MAAPALFAALLADEARLYQCPQRSILMRSSIGNNPMCEQDKHMGYSEAFQHFRSECSWQLFHCPGCQSQVNLRAASPEDALKIHVVRECTAVPCDQCDTNGARQGDSLSRHVSCGLVPVRCRARQHPAHICFCLLS